MRICFHKYRLYGYTPVKDSLSVRFWKICTKCGKVKEKIISFNTKEDLNEAQEQFDNAGYICYPVDFLIADAYFLKKEGESYESTRY